MFKQLTLSVTLSLGMLTTVSAVQAASTAETLWLSQAKYAGTGCPEESLSMSYSRGLLSISLTEMNTVNEGQANLIRKTCGISIPFDAPAGYKLVLTSQRLSGAHYLQQGSMAAISSEVFFSGSSSEPLSGSIKAVNEFQWGRIVAEDSLSLVSQCGESGILRMQLSSRVHKNGGLWLDQAKIRAKLVSCND